MKKHKNILLVSASAMPYTIDRLKSLNGQANCLTISKSEKPYIEIQNAQPITHDDLEVIFPNNSFDEISRPLRMAKVFLALVKRKERNIIIGMGGNIRPFHPDIFFAALILRIFRKNILIMFNTNFLDRERSLMIEFAKTFFLLPYKGALCSGPSAAAYIKFLGFKKKKITDFGFNTINHLRFTDNSQPINTSKNYLLFIGRMDHKKNIIFLLNAYAEYCHRLGKLALPFHLIGDGPELEHYKKIAQDLNLHSVIFAGTQSDVIIAKELSGARALLIPSIYEEWGIVVNEAISLSVPVIVSEHVRAREAIVRQFVNGLIIEPNNQEGWVKSMEMITIDDGFHKKLVEGTRRFKKLSGVESFKVAVDYLIINTN
jgi:glycosyltransferase involved in cell wall biosynthesis